MDVIKLVLPKGDQLEFQIALVDEPAIESNFMAFNRQNHFQFKEVDKAERKLMGYFMIADLEILRMDANRGAYKVVFPKESIDGIVQNFSFNGLNRNMNEMHQTGKLCEGVYVLNHWQMDSAKGITAPDGFKTEADGSWFGIVKCDNDEVYQKALNGTFNGFSIEGRFIEEAIDKYFKVNDTNNKPKILSNKLSKMSNELKEFFAAITDYFNTEKPEVKEPAKEQKFEDLLLVDGATKVTIEPAVEVGAAIVFYDSEGTPIPAPIGSYELQDNRVIVVEVEGVIASITEPTPAAEDMSDEIKTDAAPAPQETVKRLIERIEKVSEFEKQIADLKKENEFLHKENDALKVQFSELKAFTKETFEKLAAVDSKEPVAPVKKGFNFEKQEKSIYPFLNK